MRAGDAGAVGKVMALVRESLGAGWRGAVVAGAALEHSIQALARCFSGAQRVLLRGRAGDWRGDDGSCRSCRSADARHDDFLALRVPKVLVGAFHIDDDAIIDGGCRFGFSVPVGVIEGGTVKPHPAASVGLGTNPDSLVLSMHIVEPSSQSIQLIMAVDADKPHTIALAVSLTLVPVAVGSNKVDICQVDWGCCNDGKVHCNHHKDYHGSTQSCCHDA
mmetsp:Transcript_16644/g.40046  ORF Transcript_16644/g.40046 Transcript_16644/m.40046 type:complete len:219 (+) Transcript_16644:1262-1918(+)